MLFLITLVHLSHGAELKGPLEVSGTIYCNSLTLDELSLEETLSTTSGLEAQSIESLSSDVRHLYATEIVAIEEDIYIEGDLILEGPESSSSFLQRTWKMLVHFTFDTDEEGWTPAKRSTCDKEDFFLGGNDAVYSKKHFLPTHTMVRITGLVHMLDNWQGESVYLKVDSQVLWTDQAFSSHKGVNVCGNKFPDPRFAVPFDVVLKHSDSQITLQVGTTLNKNKEASFGIDDVMIFVK